MKVLKVALFAASVLLAATFSSASFAQSQTGLDNRVIPHKVNPYPPGALTTGGTGVATPAITYHGGEVMGTPNVYIIWYGNWNQTNGSDTPQGQAIVRDFLSGLSGSNYYKINTSYTTPTGLEVFHAGSFEYTDTGSKGTRLSDSKVQAVVSDAISSGKFGSPDPNGVYFVLTSSNVSESSGFCTRYCGWHTSGMIAGTNIKYSFVGNANRCLNGCAAQSVGPNGNAGVDGMISVIAHELEETNTDPNPTSGWADSGGAENADKCAWTFGHSQLQAANGAYYNMTLPAVSVPSRNYLVQRNLAANNLCYIDYLNKIQ